MLRRQASGIVRLALLLLLVLPAPRALAAVEPAAGPTRPMTATAPGPGLSISACGTSNTILPPHRESALPWWGWSLALFAACLAIGVVATLGGVGGGVLFVPLIGGFFPFGIDFVRCTGLLVALAGALASSPPALRRGTADLRLALPAGLFAAIGSIAGALVGLRLPERWVQLVLGVCILGIALVFLLQRQTSDQPRIMDNRWALHLGLGGVYEEASTGYRVAWTVHRVLGGWTSFIGIGFIAGLCGLGAGWANVPVFNLMMGAPLRVAVSTSQFTLSITDTAAVWVYLHRGALLPLMVAPSLIGMILGARLGARLLPRIRPSRVRWMVLGLLLIAGLRALTKAAGI